MATKTGGGEKTSHFHSHATAPSARSDWHKSTPRKVIVADDWSGDSPGWVAWSRHLANRRTPETLWQLLPDDQSPLLWCAPLAASEQPTAELVQWVYRLARDGSRPPKTLTAQIEAWLHGAVENVLDTGEALQALAWVHALPVIAPHTSSRTWWRLWEHLLGLANSTVGLELNGNPLVHQLVAGELPLTLAYVFPELVACRRLLKPACAALALGTERLIDSDGVPLGEHLGQFRPLLACWTRTAVVGQQLRGKVRAEHGGERFRRTVRQSIRLTRGDGAQVLARGEAGCYSAGLLQAALEVADSRKTKAIAATVLKPRLRREAIGANKQKFGKPVAEPAMHSSWSHLAVLRSGWDQTGEMLAVNYTGARVETELVVAGNPLWSGAWTLDIQIDGTAARPAGLWNSVRYASDGEVDHLELEIEYSGDVRVRRHMVLAREDRLLFMADAIQAPLPCRIEYAASLPLVQQARFDGATETREGFVRTRRHRALVIPLALPEWRRDPRGGHLAEVGRTLELRQTAQGSSLYAPLLIHLDQRRNRRPMTWRQLHVGEQLTNQPADVAVGYRAQVGSQQWLLYRSLAHKGSRTILGVNLISEFLLARFTRKGSAENLLEVD